MANVAELFEKLNFNVSGNFPLEILEADGVVFGDERINVVNGKCSLVDSFFFWVFFSSMYAEHGSKVEESVSSDVEMNCRSCFRMGSDLVPYLLNVLFVLFVCETVKMM